MASGKGPMPPHSGANGGAGAGGGLGPGGGAGHALTAEERAEHERLRRHAGVRHRRLRKAGASVLLVVPLLLARLAVDAAWVQDTVTDTDGYVETVAPPASDPAVQQVVIPTHRPRPFAEGLTVFAAVMLVIAGVLDICRGVMAVAESSRRRRG